MAVEKTLHQAAIDNDLESIRAILSTGVDVNHTNEEGETALHLAAMYGNVGALDILLNKGANIDACNKSGNNAFNIAVLCNKTEASDTLLDRGANINNIGNRGYTPLYIAILSNKTQIIELLCESGRLSSKSFTIPSMTFMSFEHVLNTQVDCAETKELVLAEKEKAKQRAAEEEERWSRRNGGNILRIFFAAANARYEKEYKTIAGDIQKTLKDLGDLPRLEGEARNLLVQKINQTFEKLELDFYDAIQKGARSFVDDQLLKLKDAEVRVLLDEKTNKVAITRLAESQAVTPPAPGFWSSICCRGTDATAPGR